MLRFKMLRNLLFLSLALAILMPVCQALLVYPAYNKLHTRETEREATRYARYMVRVLGLENQSLTKGTLPEGLAESLLPAQNDKRLVKLRIFSAQGVVIFSTQAEEIGNVNNNSYFKQIVAKGRVYSKVVQKDRTTAEGVVTRLDVVETYVPFMADDDFGGAFEVYSDITENVREIESLSRKAIFSTVIMSLGFLLAIFIALYRAYVSFQERERAERALHLANEELEQRVEERTRELSEANRQLTGEISERTQAQAALGLALEESRADREKLDGILRSVPDGVVVTDGELKVMHMNSAAESIFHKSLDQVLGQAVGILSTDVDLQGEVGQRLNNNALASVTFDFGVSRADSHRDLVYQGRVSQFLSETTDAPGVILLLRDITRERDVERMKSSFLGMATHELNTPLTTIIGYSELLTAQETAGSFDAEQQKTYLHLIHDKALALGGLVDDLLDISRVESGRPLSLSYEEFHLDELIRRVATPACDKDESHPVAIDFPDLPVKIFADQLRLEQIVTHLISNAVKYSPGGGRIRITLQQSDTNCTLSVEDEGIGMNKEQLSHIFDRFYRADSSDTAVQGVGLGMSIVRNIVLAHHGDIHVESQIGGGTTVTISLPKNPVADTSEQGGTPGRSPLS